MSYKNRCWVVPVNTRGPHFKKTRSGHGVYLVAAKNEKSAIEQVRRALRERNIVSVSIAEAWEAPSREVPERNRVYLIPEGGDGKRLDPANYI